MGKMRLDCLLMEKGYFTSREKARACIMSGNVYVNANREDKPGSNFDENSQIEVKEPQCPYVSRGGFKLKKAIDKFGLNFDGKLAMDVGASTGGFTDCMLKHGAKGVIAVDVGYGQLAWELRNDSRVFCMERTNIRYINPLELPFKPNFVTVDVSFISLKKVIPVILDIIYNKFVDHDTDTNNTDTNNADTNNTDTNNADTNNTDTNNTDTNNTDTNNADTNNTDTNNVDTNNTDTTTNTANITFDTNSTITEFVCLIKPQFEAGREKVGKKGVVREISTHLEVCINIVNFVKSVGIQVIDLSYSPIKGPEGNIEFLFYGKKVGKIDMNYKNEKLGMCGNESVVKDCEKDVTKDTRGSSGNIDAENESDGIDEEYIKLVVNEAHNQLKGL